MKKIFTILFLAVFSLNNINAATFTSHASGNWNTPATWNVVGVDPDGIPDSNDDITINAGHTITIVLAAQDAKSIVNNGTINGNGKKLNLFGNFTNNSSVTGIAFLYIKAASVFSSSVVFNGASNWWITGNLTISAGTSISMSGGMVVQAVVTNLGSVNSPLGFPSMIASSKWINSTASSLILSANVSALGILDASAANNTVTYQGTAKEIKNSTYYNLVLNGTSTKSVTANLVVQNNLTIGAGATNLFNLNNKNLSVGGNWTNSSNKTILNQGTITFNGSGTQTITRVSNEVITNMVVGGTGTVLLGTSMTVSNNLTLNSGTLDVSASNYTVNVGGNLTNNSTINARSGLFNFNGAVAQTVSGSATNNFYDVTSANAAGVSISSSAVISNILKVSSGAFGTSGAGTIKIPATGATTYGRIGTVGGSLTGTGWTIESYIDGPAPKGWQWLSSPINGNILADWDNDPRFYMSGVSGNDGNAGSFKSVRYYTEATGLYTNITTTAFPLTACQGIQVWMADNNVGLTAPLVYNSVGTPNFGNKSIAVTAGGAGSGYNLVGNPYACPVTYSTVVAASGNLFSSFIILQESGTYATDPNGGIIAPNQGFMCCASSGGSIIFTEACKNTSSLPNILKTAQKSNAITFSVFNNINGLGGQTSIEFSENFADIFEQNQDLSFLASPYDDADNVWTNSTDNKSMLKNSLNSKDDEKHVPLTVKSGVYGTHHITVKGLSSLTKYNSVVLEDLTTGRLVNLKKESTYDFSADEIGKDYNFMVHFSKDEKSPKINNPIVSNILNENTSVYNTPSNVVVKFDMTEETPVQISVYNLSGEQAIQPINMNVTNDRIALPLQKENGLYLLIIKSKDEQITRKIIY